MTTAWSHPGLELPADPLDHRRHAEPVGALPHPLAALAVVGLGGDHQPGAHQAVGRQPRPEVAGQLAGDEHERVGLLHRLLEHLLDAPAGRRIVRVRRARVAAAGDAVGERAGMAEAGEHVGRRQGGEVAEAADAEPGEQVDERVVEPGDGGQQAHRQRGEERAATPRPRARTTTGAPGRAARRAATAAVNRPSATPMANPPTMAAAAGAAPAAASSSRAAIDSSPPK